MNCNESGSSRTDDQLARAMGLSTVEPVKTPSDDDLFTIHDEFFPTMVIGHDNYLRFARALLARYIQPAQPAAISESVGQALEENRWRNALVGLCNTDRIDTPEQAVANVKARMPRMGAQSAASAEPDVVLRVVHSEYEVEEPEVVKTGRRFDNLPAGTEVKLYAAPVAAQPNVPRTQVDHTPPYGNCSFSLCDLPGQCRSEGKCHHPATDGHDDIEGRAHQLVWDAAQAGMVLRIDLVPRKPFAMGNVQMVVDVRPARPQQEKTHV